MAKTRKIKLTDDYTNWWAVAGDIYGGKRGQRAYAILKAANPGVTRFTRGMTIRVPDIDVSRVRLSDQEVARERGEVDQYGNPTQDYWNARNQVGQPPQAQTMGATTANFGSPIANFYANQYGTPSASGTISGGQTVQAPPGFGVPPVQRAGAYSPSRRREIIENARYTPERPQDFSTYTLPRENYEYFYGPNPQREAADRVRMRKEQERAALDARQAEMRRNAAMADPRRGRGFAPTPPSYEEISREARRLRGGQYGTARDSTVPASS